MQCVHRNGHNSQRFTRLAALPARYRAPALRLEVIEIFAEGVNRIQIIFAECEGAGRGRSPRVHEGHLYNIKMLRSRTQERTAVRDVNVNIGTIVKMLRVIRVPTTHDRGGDDGIDFDSGDARTAIGYGSQHINATAWPNDCEISVWA